MPSSLRTIQGFFLLKDAQLRSGVQNFLQEAVQQVEEVVVELRKAVRTRENVSSSPDPRCSVSIIADYEHMCIHTYNNTYILHNCSLVELLVLTLYIRMYVHNWYPLAVASNNHT